MNNEELQALIDNTQWSFLGKGAYNWAYLSETELTIKGYTGRWVYKKASDTTSLLSEKKRAIRKWSLINPSLPAVELSDGWLVPYLGNTAAPDAQMAVKVIEIYRRTRNILVDACAKNNFLIHQDKVVCIDMDCSLRRGSFASDEFMRLDGKLIPPFLEAHNSTKLETARVIRTLLYLEKKCPESQIKAEHITPEVIAKLRSFRLQEKPINAFTLDTLLDLTRFDPRNAIPEDKIIEALTRKKPAERPIAIFLYAVQYGLLNWVRTLISENEALIHATDAYQQSALFWAVANRHRDIVNLLMSNGAKVNQAVQIPAKHRDYNTYHHRTPLDSAILNGDTDLCLILMHAGAIANKKHSTMHGKSLGVLIAEGRLNEVRVLVHCNKALLQHLDDQDHTPLHTAAAYGQLEIARCLLLEGADINAIVPTTLKNCVNFSYPHLTALDVALDRQQEPTVLFLFNRGASPSQWVDGKYHLIHFAAKNGQLTMVQTLLRQDRTLIYARDSFHQTALLWAAANGHTEIVHFLIEMGSDIHAATQLHPSHEAYATTHNATPLMWAKLGGHRATINVLEDAISRIVDAQEAMPTIVRVVDKPRASSPRGLTTRPTALIERSFFAPAPTPSIMKQDFMDHGELTLPLLHAHKF